MKKIIKSEPLVSVVLPVFNGENFFEQALESLLNQTYKNLEIIVIDDGSDDNSFVEGIINKAGDQRIKFVRKENGGVASALNLSLQIACGKYWTWLSHDDLYHYDKIKIQVNHLEFYESNNKIISFSNHELINEKDELIYVSNFADELLKVKTSLGPVERGLISGCTLMMHTSLMREIGDFNENLKYTQDYDYWLRIVSFGAEFKLINQALVKVRIHKNQGSSNPKNYQEISELWVKIASTWLEEVKLLNNDQIILNYLQDYLQFAISINQDRMIDAIKNWRLDFLQKYSVAVILPFHNRLGYLPRAIKSILNQTHKNVCCVLVDDTQMDQKDYLHKMLANFENCTILINPETKHGPSAARNIGIDFALKKEFDYLAFLDSDDFFLPQKIELQLESMIRNNSSFSHTDYILENELTAETKYVSTMRHSGEKQFQFILDSGCSIAMPTTMFKVQNLREINLKFDVDKSVGEDLHFYLEYLFKTRESLLHFSGGLTFVREHNQMHALNGESLNKVKKSIEHLMKKEIEIPIDTNEKQTFSSPVNNSKISLSRLKTFLYLIKRNFKSFIKILIKKY